MPPWRGLQGGTAALRRLSGSVVHLGSKVLPTDLQSASSSRQKDLPNIEETIDLLLDIVCTSACDSVEAALIS